MSTPLFNPQSQLRLNYSNKFHVGPTLPFAWQQNTMIRPKIYVYMYVYIYIDMCVCVSRTHFWDKSLMITESNSETNINSHMPQLRSFGLPKPKISFNHVLILGEKIP